MTAPDPIPPQPSAEGLFHQARALASPEERAEFLAQACGEDRALLARVEALLHADAAGSSFLKTGSDSVRTTQPAPLVERPGQIIGRYKLLQLIGEGGFGSVFMAEQDEPVRRRVALKIIKPGMDSRMVAARFEAERQALALMDHPHIARVFDGGITDAALGARPYFVMEYVIGDQITRFADAHRLSVPDRLALFTQVCEAVQHAHTKGIIHRDLKPTNVLVSMVDGKPFAKVIDFGIAKSLASRLTEKTLFTEHRQLIGTPEYMSPEQAEGSPDIDTRTDVYALGVLLYELLTGATPFDAERLRSAAFAEMQRIIKEEDPPAPSLRISRSVETLAATAAARRMEPARLGATVRGELDWIVMKALEKDRGRRYESASQLGADVGRHLAGEAVVAAPAGVGYRVRKFVRRHRGPVAAGAAVFLALGVGMAGTFWQWTSARRAFIQLQATTTKLSRQSRELEATLGQVLAEMMPHNVSAVGGGTVLLPDGHIGELQYVEVLDSDGIRRMRPRVTNEHPVTGAEDPTYDDLEFAKLAMLSEVAIGNTIAVKQRTAELSSANTSLTNQRDQAIGMLQQLACGLTQDAIDSGSINLQTLDPPGYISFVSHTPLGGGPQGALVRLDASNKPELVFYKGNISATPLHQIDPHDADPEFVVTVLRDWISGSLSQATERRRQLEAATAALIKQRDAARLAQADAIYANCVDEFEDHRDPTAHHDRLPDVIKTREELLGPGHIDTVKAMCLWARAQVEPTHGRNNRKLQIDLYEGAARRLEAACGQPDSDLLMQYVEQFYDSLDRLDLDAASRWAGRIGRAVPIILDREALASLQRDEFEFPIIDWGFDMRDPRLLTAATARRIGEVLSSIPRRLLLQAAAVRAYSNLAPYENGEPRNANPSRVAELIREQLVAAPDDPVLLGALGLMQYQQGQPAEALASARAATASRLRGGQSEMPFDAAVAALALYELGRSDEARTELARCRDMVEGPNASPHWDAGFYKEAKNKIDPAGPKR